MSETDPLYIQRQLIRLSSLQNANRNAIRNIQETRDRLVTHANLLNSVVSEFTVPLNMIMQSAEDISNELEMLTSSKEFVNLGAFPKTKAKSVTPKTARVSVSVPTAPKKKIKPNNKSQTNQSETIGNIRKRVSPVISTPQSINIIDLTDTMATGKHSSASKRSLFSPYKTGQQQHTPVPDEQHEIGDTQLLKACEAAEIVHVGGSYRKAPVTPKQKPSKSANNQTCKSTNKGE